MRRCVFLDRDGTLNEMVCDETHGTLDSPRRPDQVRLAPGAAAFLREARRRDWLLVVVTNQPGLAKGTLRPEDLEAVHARLRELLAGEGASWDDLLWCPHHPAGRPGVASPWVMDCDCRKPRPGLLLQAAARWDVDLARSWMVGDGLNDVQAGQRAGCRTLLLAPPKIEPLTRLARMGCPPPTRTADDLRQALDILAEEGRRWPASGRDPA